MFRRLIATGLTGALSFSIASSAIAATSDEILAEQKAFDPTEMCADKTEKLRGKCISDMLKQVNRLKDDFREALRDERRAWDDTHAKLGVSAEYSAALQEFTKATFAKRKAFDAQQRILDKLFFDAQKTYRSESGGKNNGFSRAVTKEDVETATQKCAKHKDSSAVRICMRQQLRLHDPAARTRGAGVRLNGSN